MKHLLSVGLVGFILLVGCAVSPYRQAEMHLSNKEYDEAIRAYVKTLQPHTRNGKRFIKFEPNAVTGIGIAFCYKKQYHTGAKILKLVVDKYPAHEQALFYLGACYEGLKRYDLAEETYSRYPAVDASSMYRDVMKWRLMYIVKRKMAFEIRQALANENQLAVEAIPTNSIAVLYFYNLTNNSRWKPLQKGLAEMMITDLSQVPQLNVVERMKLEKLMEELNLSAAGLTDQEEAPRLGKLLGVRRMVKGSYMILPDMKIELNAGAFDILDRSLPELKNFDGDLGQLFNLEKQVVLNTIAEMGITLTAEQRANIMKVPTTNLKAFLNYCYGLNALDMGNMGAAQNYFNKAVELDANFSMASDLIASPEIIQAAQLNDVGQMNTRMAELGMASTDPTQSQDGVKPARRQNRRSQQQMGLLDPMDRLEEMGRHMDAGFLPGADSRQSFEEYRLLDGRLLDVIDPPFRPERWFLPEPPQPPQGR